MAPFCSMLAACKLENGIPLVEQTPATTENILRIRLPIGDVPVGEGKIPESRLTEPIITPEIVPRLRCPIADATVDSKPRFGRGW